MTKTCQDYTVVELRAKAVQKNITGRSKLDKKGLCKALGISVGASTRKTKTPKTSSDGYTVKKTSKKVVVKRKTPSHNIKISVRGKNLKSKINTK